ncbi:MAG TPA: DUF2269 family protein [Candidatus Thermoplasmatota archaeon]|nr:DUF2269 family protein [Candidatus Thermoplasmatota archaeon]
MLRRLVVSGYLVLKWLHVLTAAYLVGSIVTEFMIRTWAARAAEPAVRRFAWDFLVRAEERIAIPGALILLASGLLMVYGPWSGGWSLTGDLWVLLGLVGFLVLLVMLAGVAGSAAKRALAAHTAGDAAAAAPHERRYSVLLASGFVLAAGVVWLMVVKPF